MIFWFEISWFDEMSLFDEMSWIEKISWSCETSWSDEISWIGRISWFEKVAWFILRFVVKNEEEPSKESSTDLGTKELLGYKWDPEKDDLSPGLGELNLNKKQREKRKPNLELVKTVSDTEKLLMK